MPEFAPHGDAVMEVRGRILVFMPRGPGNREEIERLLLKVDEVAPTAKGSVWGILIDADDNHLLTPDAEARLREEMPQLIRRGQIATAIVVRAGATGSILEAQFRRIYRDADCQIERFQREADAVEWLNQCLWRSKR